MWIPEVNPALVAHPAVNPSAVFKAQLLAIKGCADGAAKGLCVNPLTAEAAQQLCCKTCGGGAAAIAKCSSSFPTGACSANLAASAFSVGIGGDPTCSKACAKVLLPWWGQCSTHLNQLPKQTQAYVKVLPKFESICAKSVSAGRRLLKLKAGAKEAKAKVKPSPRGESTLRRRRLGGGSPGQPLQGRGGLWCHSARDTQNVGVIYKVRDGPTDGR